MSKRTPLLIIVAVLAAVVAAGTMLLRSKQAGSQASGASSITGPSTSATNTPNVSVTLEEFGDYQCHPCGVLHPELKKIKERYGAHLNIVFRNLPLTKIHKNAFAAAQAAEAAR